MRATNSSAGRQFKSGILDNNPVLVQLLGMCPTLAVTNSLENALVMGAAATFVVVMSNLITSLLRNLIKPHVRILIFTLTIATFVTIADLVLKAYMYDVSKQLGAFIPLIIVNCMIICRAEVVAIKSGVGARWRRVRHRRRLHAGPDDPRRHPRDPRQRHAAYSRLPGHAAERSEGGTPGSS
jgi:electron transport complex protein RnfE